MKLKELLAVVDPCELVEATQCDHLGNPVIVQTGYCKDFLGDDFLSLLDKEIEAITLGCKQWLKYGAESFEDIPCLFIQLKEEAR